MRMMHLERCREQKQSCLHYDHLLRVRSALSHFKGKLIPGYDGWTKWTSRNSIGCSLDKFLCFVFGIFAVFAVFFSLHLLFGIAQCSTSPTSFREGGTLQFTSTKIQRKMPLSSKNGTKHIHKQHHIGGGCPRNINNIWRYYIYIYAYKYVYICTLI